MISESELDSIRNATEIVDLIGEYVALKKAGQGYVGLCPFHGEKTASFHVHPVKQIFHCFGCQKGGNIFSFISAIEGLSFPDAVQKLAKRAGISLEERRGSQTIQKPGSAQNERLKTALEWAAKYFHYLLTELDEYGWARDYLYKRGLSDRTIKLFRIGMAPRGWNTLMDLMLKRHFTFEELAESGLIVAKDAAAKKGYDRFRERLIFPIRDIEGIVIGFGARLMNEDQNQPKYINSPESLLFSKRKTLFGLYESQRGIRLQNEAVIVEGYMDVIGLAHRGVNNAIATMGTALTDEHCLLLKSLTQKVVTVFDPDEAGQEAWKRSVHLFLHYGLFAKDLTLPENLDPDEFIQKEGCEKFYSLCKNAPRQITKLLKEIASNNALSEEEVTSWLSELTPILVASRRLPDRALLWDNISLVLNVSLGALKELAESGSAKFISEPSQKNINREPATTNMTGVRKIPNASRSIKGKEVDKLDYEFFKAAMKAPHQFKMLERSDWEPALRHTRIRHWLIKLHEAGGQESKVLESLVMSEEDSLLQSSATESLMQQGPEFGGSDSSKPALKKANRTDEEDIPIGILADRLRQRKKELEIKSLSAQIRLTEKLGSSEEGLRLLKRLKELRTP